MRVVVDGQAEAIVGQQVTADYFDVLGIRPIIGNVITPRDEQGSTPKGVAVLGHAYWVRRFGGDPGILGRAITIDDVPYTIIGVTPPEFFGLQVGRRVDVSVPIDGSDEPSSGNRGRWWCVLRRASRATTAVADLNVAFQQYLAGDKTMSDRARAQGFKSLELAPASSGLPEFRDRYGKPVQAMLAIVVRAAGARMRQSRQSLSCARGCTAAGSIGVPGVRREPDPTGAPGALGNPPDLDRRRSARHARGLVGRRCADRVSAGCRRADRPADSPDRNVLLFSLCRDDADRIEHWPGAGVARPQGRYPEHALGGRTNRDARRRRVQGPHRGAGRAVDGAGRGCHAFHGHA